MVAPENLGPCQNEGLPLQQRLVEAIGVLRGFSDILKVYLAALQQEPARTLDVARISAFGVRCASVTFDLMHELVATLDEGDPTYAQRMAGVEQMRSGLARVLDGAISMIQTDVAHDPEARLAVARALGEFFPRLAGDLPELTRAELRSRIERMADEEKDERVRVELRRATAR